MHSHETYVSGCFACKLKTLQFGEVPGAYRTSTSQSYFDNEALKDGNFPTSEEVRDYRSDLRKIFREDD